MRRMNSWAALVLAAAGVGCLHASATPAKSQLQKMRDAVACTHLDANQTHQATLLSGAASQHLLAATAGVPIFGMSDLFALDQISGDPSAFGDLASILGSDNSAGGTATPDIENQEIADADTGAGGSNLDNGGDSSGGTGGVGAVNAGTVSNFSASGDLGGGGGGGSNAGGVKTNSSVSPQFSEGGGGPTSGSSVPLPAGAWAGALVIPALLMVRRKLATSVR